MKSQTQSVAGIRVGKMIFTKVLHIKSGKIALGCNDDRLFHFVQGDQGLYPRF
jgi:hypothetical protein